MKQNDQKDHLTQIAQKIVDCYYWDCGMSLNIEDVKSAINEDGYIPSLEEIPIIIAGDENGNIPNSLWEKIPALDHVLGF